MSIHHMHNPNTRGKPWKGMKPTKGPTRVHQHIIHWMPIMSQLWMNLEITSGFTLVTHKSFLTTYHPSIHPSIHPSFVSSFALWPLEQKTIIGSDNCGASRLLLLLLFWTLAGRHQPPPSTQQTLVEARLQSL
jgi:hypothetical protein